MFSNLPVSGSEAHQIQNKQVDKSSLYQTEPKTTKTSKKGFVWGGSDGVDDVARKVLQRGVANRGAPITSSKRNDLPGKVANPARGKLNREKKYFPVPVRA